MRIRTAAHALILLLLLCLAASSLLRPSAGAPALAGVVRLPATASIWLADTTSEERNSSAGQLDLVKLKSIQEMAAIRFDASGVRGQEVLSARLFLHMAGADRIRYLRVSTINQDWAQGASRRAYGPASGATCLWADADARRPWSFPGSEFADVIMGMGHSLTTYGEVRRSEPDWLSVEVTPELVYAIATGHSDGLAVMDGGNPAFFNNFIHSATAGSFAPYLDVEVGRPLTDAPDAPIVSVASAPERSHLTTGAIKVEIQSDARVFAWTVTLDGRAVPRWQVPHPHVIAATGREQAHLRGGRAERPGPVVFHLDDLEPGKPHRLSVRAVGPSGRLSPSVELQAVASPALPAPPSIGPLARPSSVAAPAKVGARFAVWPVPGLVKISPETGTAMFSDMSGDGRGTTGNAVWDGRDIRLFGGRGEYVSYQLVIERTTPAESVSTVSVTLGDLSGVGGVIGARDIELSKNWYARNGDGRWQPAYTVPWASGRSLEIPDRARGITGQTNQSVYVDVYIPKTAAPGAYTGSVIVDAGRDRTALPVRLEVYDFTLPDRLSFWPELNAYAVPQLALDYHRLAHQHRLVFNPWVVSPTVTGAGTSARVTWDAYDAAVGPLLSGQAFAGNRRTAVPTPVMYLPFIDSWPTSLSRETYRYDGAWPGKGGDRGALVDHYLSAPYIGDGLSQSYKDGFFAVQRQFVEHFRQQGWNQTEMQLFFGGKNTHRVDYGANMWWTTDEPYHWDDWLALQFFANLWADGRRALGAASTTWAVRADVSRPMWTGRVLDTVVDTIYWSGLTDQRSATRAAWLSEHTGVKTRAYGSASPATASNTQSVSTLVQVWLRGADAFLPWQTLGDAASLDQNDNVDGNTLLVPGDRFGVPVVGDMRLKAFREGQQLIEYLVILGDRYGLRREQIARMVEGAVALSSASAEGTSPDNADGRRFSTLDTSALAAIRRAVAELIVTR